MKFKTMFLNHDEKDTQTYKKRLWLTSSKLQKVNVFILNIFRLSICTQGETEIILNH